MFCGAMPVSNNSDTGIIFSSSCAKALGE